MQKEFSYPLKIEDISQGEQMYKLQANKEQLATLKEILQVPAVNSFSAAICLNFQKKRGFLEVSGKVCADLGLVSVISLEPFNKEYVADFKVIYNTTAKYEDIYRDDDDISEDLPDIVVNGQIDLGDIAIEQLALVMEDYPRQEGETFGDIIEGADNEEKNNPFALLSKLKK